MAFNDQGNGKSPWDSNKDQPPDLDQIVDEWQKRFNQLFGAKLVILGMGLSKSSIAFSLAGLCFLNAAGGFGHFYSDPTFAAGVSINS